MRIAALKRIKPRAPGGRTRRLAADGESSARQRGSAVPARRCGRTRARHRGWPVSGEGQAHHGGQRGADTRVQPRSNVRPSNGARESRHIRGQVRSDSPWSSVPLAGNARRWRSWSLGLEGRGHHRKFPPVSRDTQAPAPQLAPPAAAFGQRALSRPRTPSFAGHRMRPEPAHQPLLRQTRESSSFGEKKPHRCSLVEVGSTFPETGTGGAGAPRVRLSSRVCGGSGGPLRAASGGRRRRRGGGARPCRWSGAAGAGGCRAGAGRRRRRGR